jgi:DNA mismatch repair protein MutS
MARHIATRLKSFTLFATHYFELTTLATEVEGCANVHLDATEHGDGIVFLHAVKEGPANRSYGLQVAQLAGVPRDVIAQARHYLEALESQRDQHNGAAASNGPRAAQRELPLFAAPTPEAAPTAATVRAASAAAAAPQGANPDPDPLRAAVEALDPDELSPKAALEALYKLRKLLSPDGA